MPQEYDELICLAACFDSDAGAAFRAALRPEWFSDVLNARCFEAACILEADGLPVTAMSTAARLIEGHNSDAAGHLMENVADCLVLPSEVRVAMDRLRERHETRALADLPRLMTEYQAGHPEATTEEIRAYFESRISEIGGDDRPADVVDYRGLLESVSDRMQELADAQAYGTQDRPGLWFGLADLDRDMGGLFPGQVCIVAARPGVGKTSLAVQFAIEQALRGRRVLFCSYEMSADELVERMIRQSFPDEYLLERLSSNLAVAKQALRSLPGAVLIHDTPTTTDRQIRAIARREQAMHGLDCIVVDYVQLIPAANRSENRQQEVTAISASLKATAKMLSIPIIALSQFSRAAMESGEPQLHHLRESGSLEQDADKCLLMWLEDHDRTDQMGRKVIKARWAKNRQGPTGRLEMLFHPSRFLFSSDAAQP